MGEARQRGTKTERMALPRGKPRRWRKVWPLKPAKVAKKQSAVPKRERSKMKRAVKRWYGLKRRMLGAIGAGHVPAPFGYSLAMYRTHPDAQRSDILKAAASYKPEDKP